MKELSVEEKAKAYDKALKVLHKYDGANIMFTQDLKEEMFPELKESEDERIRKEIINYFKCQSRDEPCRKSVHDKWIAWLEKQGQDGKVWFYRDDYVRDKKQAYQDGIDNVLNNPQKYGLEKQGEHYNFRQAIQVGDQVTRNEDGVLVNLSQLKRVAKPADKVEPKFHEGEWVVYDHRPYQVVELPKEGYINLGLRGNGKIEFAPSTYCRHWTIKDAKDGDILATKAGGIFIYKELLYDKPFAYCGVDKFGVFKDCNCGNGLDWTPYLSDVTPATKEQRDLLFKKMKESGYEWDAKKKELKKIEQKPVIEMKSAEESLGIDSDTYNKIVDECILCEQNPAWSEEDEKMFYDIVARLHSHPDVDKTEYDKSYHWLESLKDRIQPKQELSEKDERMLTAILRDVMHGEPLDKLQYDWLKSLKDRVQPQPKQEWNEEDEKGLGDALWCCKQAASIAKNENDMGNIWYAERWLKSFRPQNRWKPMEDDVDRAISIMEKAVEDIEIPEKYKDSAWLSAAGEGFFRDLHRQLRDNILKAKEEAKKKI